MTPNLSDAEPLAKRRRAYLLHQLANAPDGGLTAGVANKIHAGVNKELGLTPEDAARLHEELEREGLMTSAPARNSKRFAITDAGQKQYRELSEFVPTAPAKKPSQPRGSRPKKVAGGDDGPDRPLREAYILDALSRAKNKTIAKADLALAMGKQPPATPHPDAVPFRDQKFLKLDTGTLSSHLAALAAGGEIDIRDAGDAESYTLTTSGSERLGQLRSQYPVLPPTGSLSAKTTERIQEVRIAVILLRLLESPDRAQTADEAMAVAYPKTKGYKPSKATAWQVRRELTAQGYVAARWTGEEGVYTLTPAGVKHLAGLSFDAFDKLEIKGPALTALLAAAREGSPPAISDAPAPTPALPPAPPSATPSRADLEAAVMEVFHHLLRERFANIRMVPIHEVRTAIAERFGPEAASHAVFDEMLLDLRRGKKVRLVSISDRSRATPQQLQDSVVAVGETFFHLEAVHAPVSG